MSASPVIGSKQIKTVPEQIPLAPPFKLPAGNVLSMTWGHLRISNQTLFLFHFPVLRNEGQAVPCQASICLPGVKEESHHCPAELFSRKKCSIIYGLPGV